MIPFRTLCAKLRTAIKALSENDRARLGDIPKCISGGSSYSYRVDPSEFLNVCVLLSIDPLTGGEPAPFVVRAPARIGKLALWHIAAGCSITRKLRKLSVRAAADECGVSASTLTRLENGLPVSIESILAVCDFIGVHPFHYMQSEKRRAA